MKTNTTNQTAGRAQEQPEQVTAQAGEFNKYLVLSWQGREQIAVFPFSVRHADMFRYLRRECPEIQALRAGLYLAEGDLVWCTGGSDTLQLSSRPEEDQRALAAFLKSPDRESWDLTRMSEEARAQARAEMAEAGWC